MFCVSLHFYSQNKHIEIAGGVKVIPTKSPKPLCFIHCCFDLYHDKNHFQACIIEYRWAGYTINYYYAIGDANKIATFEINNLDSLVHT